MIVLEVLVLSYLVAFARRAFFTIVDRISHKGKYIFLNGNFSFFPFFVNIKGESIFPCRNIKELLLSGEAEPEEHLFLSVESGELLSDSGMLIVSPSSNL